MRRALVTGGSRGIGLAIAQKLAQDGMQVTVTYRHDGAGAAAAVAQARAKGLALEAVACDANDPAAWQALFARDQPPSQPGHFLVEEGVGVLVHAAGFTRDKLLMSMPPADFDDVLGVHLRGAYLASQAVLRGMIGNRWGRILFVSSPTATLGRRGQTNYGAAKAGLGGLMHSLLHEVSRFRVTVNTVSVGLVDTALTAELSAAVHQELLDGIPMQRPGRPDEVAALCSFLASDAAGYVSGQTIAIDGGLDALTATSEPW